MSEQNKALVRRYLSALAEGNMAVVDELVAPDHVCDFGNMKTNNRDEYKQFLATFVGAFPDLSVKIESQVAEGDMEVHRWTGRATHQGEFLGVPPTGKQVEFSATFTSRIANGKIVEEWGIMDVMSIMQQIGALPMSQ